MSSRTSTAIPLAALPPQQPGNNPTLPPVNNGATSALTQSSAQRAISTQNPSSSSTSTSLSNSTNNQSLILPRYASGPPTWRERFENACSVANGIGTFALIVAFVFGIGAWVGMKIQIGQGGKSMELAIWTTCADHEEIQNSKLCKSIMSKDFSEFGKRDAEAEDKGVAILVKRTSPDDDGSLNTLPPLQESRLSKLLSSLSKSDRALLDGKHLDVAHYRDRPDPAIRATFLPLVNLLVRPISWIFDSVESVLLITVYCVHKLLSWMTSIVLFIIQGIIYSLIEAFLKSLLGTLDQAIWQLMPSWMPYVLASNLASWVGLSALRSFWYSTNFLHSLKWIFYFRVGMWLAVELAKGGYQLWCSWRLAVERRRMQQELRSQPNWLGLVN